MPTLLRLQRHAHALSLFRRNVPQPDVCGRTGLEREEKETPRRSAGARSATASRGLREVKVQF